jgi:hypothetical protein
MGGIGGGHNHPVHSNSLARWQKASATKPKQFDDSIALLSDISFSLRDLVLSHSFQDESPQDKIRDRGAGAPVYSNYINIFSAESSSNTNQDAIKNDPDSKADQDTVVNNHDNSSDSNGPGSHKSAPGNGGDDPGNSGNGSPSDKPDRPKPDRPFPYYYIIDRDGLGFDVDVQTSPQFLNELHKRYDLIRIDLKHILARPPDAFKELVTELGYPHLAEDAKVDALTPLMSFSCGGREVIVPHYSHLNALLRTKACVSASVSRAMENINHFTRKYRANYATQIVFPIPISIHDALARSCYQRVEQCRKMVLNSLHRLERDLQKKIRKLELEISVDFEKFRSSVLDVLARVPEHFEISAKDFNSLLENHDHALEICSELYNVFDQLLLGQIRREYEKLIEEELALLESPFVSQEEKERIKPKVDSVLSKRDSLIEWLKKRFGHIREREDENVKYDRLPTGFLYRLYLQIRRINSAVHELEAIGREAVHSFVKHLSKLYYGGAELFVYYNIHPWSSATLEPYLHAHLLLLNVIKTEDGRYIRVRPFFISRLEKTKKPYKKAMQSLNKLIKLMENLPSSFDLLAKIREHKALIYRANRKKTAIKEFRTISTEIDHSETAVRQIIDAYIASLPFEERMKLAGELAQLNDLWADVVAEWAECLRFRNEAIQEGLKPLREAYRRAMEDIGIAIADLDAEVKYPEELDEEVNKGADMPKSPYVWTGYFPIENRSSVYHVLKYMSRRPLQDLALYCLEHGDYPKLPMAWLEQLIEFTNQRSALGLARENYTLIDVQERVNKFSAQFSALEAKFKALSSAHPELNDKLAPLANKIADLSRYISELNEVIANDKKNIKMALTNYIDLFKVLFEDIKQLQPFSAEELKEKQNRLAELSKQKVEIETIRFECERVKLEIAQLEDWINLGIEREGDRERLAELQKKRAELEQKLTELTPIEEKIKAEMSELMKTFDAVKQFSEIQEEAVNASESIQTVAEELSEEKDQCPICGRRASKPTYLTTDQLAEKVEKGLVLQYDDPETRKARLCVSSKAPNAREVVSFFAVKSYTARAMLELEKTRYADRIVSEWFVSEFSRSRGDKRGNTR